MKVYIFLIVVVVLLCIKLTRCIIFNLHLVGYYGFKDFVSYIQNKKWKDFNNYGIDMYIAMFGHGKTLSMTRKAESLYKRFGESLVFLSNYRLNNIPYIPLVNFNQLVNLGEDMPEGIQGYVVCIDEISSVLSHRNYANFPLELIGLLCQQRKKHVYIMCTAQRFFMVDKIWRSITTNVIDCSKHWRFQHNVWYDAWEYENAMNASLIKRVYHDWWLVRDKVYNAYDTSQMISKTSASDFISNEDAIVRKGLDQTANTVAVKRPAKRFKKARGF